jgi:hypothetical protein
MKSSLAYTLVSIQLIAELQQIRLYYYSTSPGAKGVKNLGFARNKSLLANMYLLDLVVD